MSLEVKAYCNETSLKSAKLQLNGCKNLIEKWCADLFDLENGWSFYSVIYFHHKSTKLTFCDACSKYIIFGSEFKEKFNKIIKEIPAASPMTDFIARSKFKKVSKRLLFLASYEPVVTPARDTEEIVKMLDKAGQFDNILYWNDIFCFTPNQLALLKDESLKHVLFLSPPSCGKTFIKRAKAKFYAQKGQKVAFFIPSYNNLRTLLSFQLEQEFEPFSDNIEVINVNAGSDFTINEDFFSMLKLYRDHHIIMDEIGILHDVDIERIRNVAQHCQSANVAFWFSVTFMQKKEIRNRLVNALQDFCVIKDELSIPLRNTDSITRHAYKIEGNYFETIYILLLCPTHYYWHPRILNLPDTALYILLFRLILKLLFSLIYR